MDYYSNEYKEFLTEHFVYDMFQYMDNTLKNLNTAEYCVKVIEGFIEKIENNHVAWQDSLMKEVESQLLKNTVAKVGFGPDNMPKNQIDIFGMNVSYEFLIDKYIKDFFQYIRNTLDSIAQVVNAGLLANESKHIESVDFNRIINYLSSKKYSVEFDKTLKCLQDIKNSTEFQYINNFNNKTKHICDTNIIISQELFGESYKNEVSSFSKCKKHYDSKDIINLIREIFVFIKESYNNILIEVTEEIKKDKFIGGRLHQLKFYSQNIKSDKENSYNLIYIDGENIEELSDTIRILLVNESGALNCNYEDILIMKSITECLGKYILDESIFNDGILRYIKYKKVAASGYESQIAYMEHGNKNNAVYPLFMSGKIVRVG